MRLVSAEAGKGAPTRNPTLARQGALLPFGGPQGGYKGFGLSLMMQALGLLAGAGAQTSSDYGYLFIAFKPELIGPADVFEARVGELIDHIKESPRQPGVEEIHIPSERSARTRERLLLEGLEIDQLVFDQLTALAKRTR